MRTVRTWAFLTSVGALAGCNADPNNSTPGAPETAPAVANHFWIVHEGDGYGYAEARTPDQQGAGLRVMTFRYLGVSGGVYRLTSDQMQGKTARCANPCSTIEYTGPNGDVVNRAAFNPDTVIGAAFTDAFNGQLQANPAAAAVGSPGDRQP
jgi:hypothetical protein